MRLQEVAPKYRRQGVTLALYDQAARWMDGRHLDLHASDCQSPEAVAAWLKMERLGRVRRVPGPFGVRRCHVRPDRSLSLSRRRHP